MKYVKYISAGITGLSGCCGLGELYRTRAVYETDVQREAVMKYAADRVYISEYKSVMKEMRSSACLWEVVHKLTNIESLPISVPLEMAYAAILSRAADLHPRKAGYIMSDNIDGTGDVHTGDLGIRTFAGFLGKHPELGSVQSLPPFMSIRPQPSQLKVWLFVPNWEGVERFIAHHRSEVKAFIKEARYVQKAAEEASANRKTSRSPTARSLDAWTEERVRGE